MAWSTAIWRIAEVLVSISFVVVAAGIPEALPQKEPVANESTAEALEQMLQLMAGRPSAMAPVASRSAAETLPSDPTLFTEALALAGRAAEEARVLRARLEAAESRLAELQDQLAASLPVAPSTVERSQGPQQRFLAATDWKAELKKALEEAENTQVNGAPVPVIPEERLDKLAQAQANNDAISLPGQVPTPPPLPAIVYELPPSKAAQFGYNNCRNPNQRRGGCCQQILNPCCLAHSVDDPENKFHLCFNADTQMLTVITGDTDQNEGAVRYSILMAQVQRLPLTLHARIVGPSDMCMKEEDFTVYQFNR